MTQNSGRRLVYDLETDGLLPELTRIHIMCVKDVDTQEAWTFRHNDVMNTIPEGLALLNEAEMLIGHNVIGFDNKALWKVYGDLFAPVGTIRDTLVLARMIFADVKESDFRLWKRGTLDGGYIGTHELGAWGQRLGFPKGDYADVKAEEARAMGMTDKKEISKYVWASWNQEMEDYAVQDVVITHTLWRKIEGKMWSEDAVLLEHQIHDLMERVQDNGFPFDMEGAAILETELRDAHTEKSDRAKEHFGSWWTPARWLETNKSKSYTNPATGDFEKDIAAFKPRPEYGEDTSRTHWGEVNVPRKDMKFKDVLKGDKTAGCPFTPIKMIDFNPNSRQQIVNRLQKIYGWEPQKFTEKGSAVVDDEVLRELSLVITICDDLAEIFYYKKRLGQLSDGDNGWMGKAMVRGDSKIHARINVGGTITNRASHSSPNIGQVPRVVFLSLKQWHEEDVIPNLLTGQVEYGQNENGVWVKKNLTPLLGPDGKQIKGVPLRHGISCKCRPCTDEVGSFVLDKEGHVTTKKTLMKGRLGDHGWDCRNLFHVPKGWVLMGSDQKGIELRALGHYMWEFDGGEYSRLVVESDPHDLHQKVMELDSRDTAKTVIYAMIFGAQDYKLGITVDPMLANHVKKAKELGTEMRRRLMVRIPAFGSVVKAVQREAKRGYIEGLDGRHLFVRSRHAALNTKLQGAAATVAKKWCVNFEKFCEDDGLVHGWDGDFAIVTWVHDELQVAVRDDPEIMEICRLNIIEAAAAAGQYLNFNPPVNVDCKFGTRWSETH